VVETRDILKQESPSAKLMPMSADVCESSGNSLPFTCNAVEQGSKIQLAIIVLVHLKCRSKNKIIQCPELTPISTLTVQLNDIVDFLNNCGAQEEKITMQWQNR
jgi:hypothetical protein